MKLYEILGNELVISQLEKLLAAGRHVKLDWMQHARDSSKWHWGTIKGVKLVPALLPGSSPFYRLEYDRAGLSAALTFWLSLSLSSIERAKLRKDHDSWVFTDRDKEADDDL